MQLHPYSANPVVHFSSYLSLFPSGSTSVRSPLVRPAFHLNPVSFATESSQALGPEVPGYTLFTGISLNTTRNSTLYSNFEYFTYLVRRTSINFDH